MHLERTVIKNDNPECKITPLLNFLQDHQYAITIVTETWANKPIAHQFEGIGAIQSPLNQHQGIIILIGK